MSWVGFEPMIPAFERAKTVHALDRAAAVIGSESPSHSPSPSYMIVWLSGRVCKVSMLVKYFCINCRLHLLRCGGWRAAET
jgi:hypothetical protein